MINSSFDTIYSAFPPANAEDWKRKIIKDLKEKKIDDLTSYTADEIAILPFYTIDDNEKYKLTIPPTQHQDCLNTAIVDVTDVPKANKEALLALQQGIQCIVFDLNRLPITAEQILLLTKDIYTEHAPVFFDNFLSETKAVLEGTVGNSTINKLYVPQQKSKINELVYALLRIYHSDEKKHRVHFVVGQHFFLEISKARAFRWLVAQLNELHKCEKEIVLIAETGFENRSDEVVENNILRNTTEAMSALLGGYFGLITHAHAKNSLGNRMARNVKNILGLESNFYTNDSFTNGAYFVEYLTYQLAKKTWERLT